MNNKILLAAQFAKKAHNGQIRKYSGKPYITHPARVASRVCLLDGATEDMVCAAFLHDTIEDCGTECSDLVHAGLSEMCVSYVWELTNPSKGKNLPRSERKEMDRRHLRLVSPEAKCIKLLDRIDNIAECSNAPKDWLILYLKESRLLLETLNGVCEELEDELNYYINTYSRKLGMEI